MAKVIRARYEKGTLKPLEELDLSEGEELTIVIKSKSFYQVARELQTEAREDVDKLISEARGRGKKLHD